MKNFNYPDAKIFCLQKYEKNIYCVHKSIQVADYRKINFATSLFLCKFAK